MDFILELDGVGKTFVASDGSAGTSVLSGVNLKLGVAEAIAVTGPSGSGKTTLLHLMATLDRPTSGRILVDGSDVTGMDEMALGALRNRRIGLVFQKHHLLPQLSVIENVLLPTVPAGKTAREQAYGRACHLLKRVGLDGRLDSRPGILSGGECQRVAVVRALINSPALLLADEPTGSLDRHTGDRVVELLADLNREEGVALVVVTHASSVAERIGRIYRLEDGHLISA